MIFDDLDLNPELLESIDYMGFSEATPIQEKAIPVIMSGRDLIACAQTGTGKTAAFLLPIMNHISEKRPSHTHTLILVPTRELALQIDQQIQGLAYTLNITSLAVYGGGDGNGWDQEKAALSKGADIIVATPGRLISHLNQGYVKFNQIEVLVLDEADRMLDIGFYDDIMRIISYVPKKRQTLMFSATMPPKIRSMSKHIMKNPVEIALEMSKPPEGVIQAIYKLSDNQKLPLINSLIADNPDYHSILIFSSTKKKLSEIVRGLRSKNYLVEGISSDLEQKEREEMLLRFKSRKTRVLVATDVLSRGIDIKDINLVINFDAPSDAEDYVHRVGRTARAETTGVAVTLVNKADMPKMYRIEKLIGNKIYNAPLPAFIAEGHDKRPAHRPFLTKYEKGGFRRKFNQKSKRQGVRDN
ncbi:MAG: DEAD/DEAH box helicase [Bacteroidales bacterium]|jgi:superfamily II DNA/RNA helicase|nr:DEAD/DEAH box helicase [Bacteroidales bacterium]